MADEPTIDRLIQELVAAGLDEKRELIEQHAAILLDPAIDQWFADRLANLPDEQSRQTLSTYHGLLTECRDRGMAKGFADMQARSRRSFIQDYAQKLAAMLPDWNGFQQGVSANPEFFLNDEFLRMLTRMEMNLQAYRECLQEVREEGIETVFARYTIRPDLLPADAQPMWHELARLEQQDEQASDEQTLQEKIRLCRDLLNRIDHRRLTMMWAIVQDTLGNALRVLGEREGDTAKLEAAVASYQFALEGFTQSGIPLQWAMVQNNLGNALQALGERESGTARLEAAVASYQFALGELTQSGIPLQWAATHNNLGKALATLGEREGDTARLEEAVGSYYAALEESTQERVPLLWATIYDNLGNTLRVLSEREGDTARLEEAVASHRLALEERTQERVPLLWAMTHNNLGNALMRLGEREGDPARLEQAIISFRLALEELTQARVPLNNLWTRRPLAGVLADLGRWEAASAELGDLLTDGVRLARSAQSGNEQRLALKTLAGVGDLLALAEVELGRPARALAAAGRGRAVLLAAALSLDEAATPEVVRQLKLQLRDLSAARTALGQAEQGEDWDLRRQHRAAVTSQSQAFHQALAEAGLDQVPEPSLEQVAAALPAGGVLAVPYVTEHGGGVLLLRAGSSTVAHLPLPELTSAAVMQLLFREDQSGWFDGYNDYYQALQVWAQVQASAAEDVQEAAALRSMAAAGFARWNATILQTGERLFTLLMGPLHDWLQAQSVSSDAELVLMPPGRLAALPLHAARHPVTGRYLIQDWCISYVPSLHSLVDTRHKAKMPVAPSLLALTDSRRDLRLSADDNVAVPFFAQAAVTHLVHDQATLDNVVAALTDRRPSYLNVLCHGQWDHQHPERSAILLAGDADLDIHRIRSLPALSLRLVTLGACESGVPDIRHLPDELTSLPTAFLEHGTTGVKVSLWSVFGGPTRAIDHDLYQRHLQQGETPLRALHACLKAMLAGQLDLAAYDDPDRSFRRTPPPEPTPAITNLFRHHDTHLPPWNQPFHWAAWSFHGC